MTDPGTIYRSTMAGRLHPRHVRDRQFGVTHIGRRGLDPREVRQFLHRVAYELAVLHRELARSNDENARIKRALRSWQSEQTTRSRW